MSHQFKPGDLALVIGGRSGLNIGKVVTIERMFRSGEQIKLDALHLNCVSDGWLVSGDLVAMTDRGIVKTKQHGFRAHVLMPLRGDFTPEQQKAKEVPA